MTDRRTQAHVAESNMQKDPDDGTTGDEPIRTHSARIRRFARKPKEPFDQTSPRHRPRNASRSSSDARTGRAPVAARAPARVRVRAEPHRRHNACAADFERKGDDHA